MKRLLATGSRVWPNGTVIEHALRHGRVLLGDHDVTLVHGACPTGADTMAEEVWSG